MQSLRERIIDAAKYPPNTFGWCFATCVHALHCEHTEPRGDGKLEIHCHDAQHNHSIMVCVEFKPHRLLHKVEVIVDCGPNNVSGIPFRMTFTSAGGVQVSELELAPVLQAMEDEDMQLISTEGNYVSGLRDLFEDCNFDACVRLRTILNKAPTFPFSIIVDVLRHVNRITSAEKLPYKFGTSEHEYRDEYEFQISSPDSDCNWRLRVRYHPHTMIVTQFTWYFQTYTLATITAAERTYLPRMVELQNQMGITGQSGGNNIELQHVVFEEIIEAGARGTPTHTIQRQYAELFLDVMSFSAAFADLSM